jgi:rubrerythrin
MLAEWSSDDSHKKHYENLAAMELNHKHRLENMFVDIGYPEAW